MTNLTTAVTAVFGWAGDAIGFITNEPILLVSVAIFCVGAGIGLVKRVLR